MPTTPPRADRILTRGSHVGNAILRNAQNHPGRTRDFLQEMPCSSISSTSATTTSKATAPSATWTPAAFNARSTCRAPNWPSWACSWRQLPSSADSCCSTCLTRCRAKRPAPRRASNRTWLAKLRTTCRFCPPSSKTATTPASSKDSWTPAQPSTTPRAKRKPPPATWTSSSCPPT